MPETLDHLKKSAPLAPLRTKIGSGWAASFWANPAAAQPPHVPENNDLTVEDQVI